MALGRLGAHRPVTGELAGVDGKQLFLEFVGIGHYPTFEPAGTARYFGDSGGDQPAGAGFRHAQHYLLLLEQVSGNRGQGLLVEPVDMVPQGLMDKGVGLLEQRVIDTAHEVVGGEADMDLAADRIIANLHPSVAVPGGAGVC